MYWLSKYTNVRINRLNSEKHNKMNNSPYKIANAKYKRPFDILVLLIGHIVLSPILIPIWITVPLLIWIYDRGPIFYMQERLGKNGDKFKIFKFRTMTVGAEISTGAIWATENDIRVTSIGKVLRRWRIDELPQTINILKADMSLVGPRPERPELAESFETEIPGFHSRLTVRPGFAGLAQVRGRYSTKPRNKLRYDQLYIKRLSFCFDIKLLVCSFWIVVKGFQH